MFDWQEKYYFSQHLTHCLGMNYYVNFLGGIGSKPPVYLLLIFEIECHSIFFQFRNIKFKKSKNQFDFEIDFCGRHGQ